MAAIKQELELAVARRELATEQELGAMRRELAKLELEGQLARHE